MPIRFQCECGKALAVDEKLAGRKGKCPACGRSVNVPEVADPSECPSCQSDMPPGSVICVRCGFDTRSGSRHNTVVERRSSKPTRMHRGVLIGGSIVVVLVLLGLGAARLLLPSGDGNAQARRPAEWTCPFPCEIVCSGVRRDDGMLRFDLAWTWKPGFDVPDVKNSTLFMLYQAKNFSCDLDEALLSKMRAPGTFYKEMSIPYDHTGRVVMRSPERHGFLIMFFLTDKESPVHFAQAGNFEFSIRTDSATYEAGGPVVAVGLFEQRDPSVDHMKSNDYRQLSNVVTPAIPRPSF